MTFQNKNIPVYIRERNANLKQQQSYSNADRKKFGTFYYRTKTMEKFGAQSELQIILMEIK